MKLLQGDCLELLKTIPDGTIDMVLTDPPYGTTACKWDNLIDFAAMWTQLKRVVKENAAICLFGAEPFSSHLRLSKIKEFKYDWVWDKINKFTGHLNAKKMPMCDNEIISVFYSKQPTYNPQLREGSYVTRNSPSLNKGVSRSPHRTDMGRIVNGLQPGRIIRIPSNSPKRVHPTEKPVVLLEYLIKTYTLPGETVLDFTMGSGSTGVACKNTGRDFIGIELDEKYFAIAKERIEATDSYCEREK